MSFIIFRIVIVFNKRKIFFLFFLESGWFSVYIGREVILVRKEIKINICMNLEVLLGV